MANDWVSTTFYTHKDLRADDSLIKVLNQVLNFGNPLIPKKCDLGKATNNRYKKFEAGEAIKKLRTVIPSYEQDSLVFDFATFSDEDGYTYNLHFSRRSFDGVNKFGRKASANYISIDLDTRFFSSESFCSRFVDLAKSIYDILSPVYGVIHDSSDYRALYNDAEWIGKTYGTSKFYMVYWANFLSPEGVSLNGGWDKIKGTPCFKVERLKDGGALLLLAPTPLNPDSKEFRDTQNKVLSYFGLPIIDEGYYKRIKRK